ncbi:MAG: hypothetical protein K2Q25_05035, partial [Mycobacteriaceae bacterium]|nr:hypothetical protein [Mycobacteriaceae bacterium]
YTLDAVSVELAPPAAVPAPGALPLVLASIGSGFAGLAGAAIPQAVDTVDQVQRVARHHPPARAGDGALAGVLRARQHPGTAHRGEPSAPRHTPAARRTTATAPAADPQAERVPLDDGAFGPEEQAAKNLNRQTVR